MKLLPSLLKSWPSCQQPRTLSFRAYHQNQNDNFFKTINSAYVDDPDEEGDAIESVIRGLRSDRLFFDPDETSSLLHSKPPVTAATTNFDDSFLLSMESKHPYVDFRKSMEEMVEAHSLKDWDALEDLLFCYLRVNPKSNHSYILSAFVDLMFSSVSSSSPSPSSSSVTNSHSSSSPLSFYTSSSSPSSSSATTPSASCLEPQQDVDQVQHQTK